MRQSRTPRTYIVRRIVNEMVSRLWVVPACLTNTHTPFSNELLTNASLIVEFGVEAMIGTLANDNRCGSSARTTLCGNP